MASTTGDVILLTGGTSGIGRRAARKLAARGATVLITGRDRSGGRAALAEIEEVHPEGVGAFYRADFADLDDVRRLAADVRADYDRLDVLVNNAGMGMPVRRSTDDGIEYTFAVNHVAPFLLTHLLLPELLKSTPARVLTTTSFAYERGDLSDVEAVVTGENFHFMETYAHSKLAGIVFTYELAERLEGTGVTATCYHPGWVPTTALTRNAPLRLKATVGVARLVSRVAAVGQLETLDGAADAIVHHATDQELPDGEGTLFDRREPLDPPRSALDRDLRKRLWERTAELADLAETLDRRDPENRSAVR